MYSSMKAELAARDGDLRLCLLLGVADDDVEHVQEHVGNMEAEWRRALEAGLGPVCVAAAERMNEPIIISHRPLNRPPCTITPTSPALTSRAPG